MATRNRFSRRHLLALSTFLVPLAVLALLGGSELQRTGALAQTALAREARQFLVSAGQAIGQEVDQFLAALLPESESLLLEPGPVKAVLRLREDARFAALRSIVMIDDQALLVFPTLPPASITLPFANDPHRNSDNPARAALAAADLLLTDRSPSAGDLHNAIDLLQQVITQIETANPPSRDRRPDLEDIEMIARFRLATTYRRIGAMDSVPALLERVKSLATARGRSPNMAALGLLSEEMLAQLGTPAQRRSLLEDIAEGRRDHADGLANAVALRLAATFEQGTPERPEIDQLLNLEAQRAATRSFAANYENFFTYRLRLHMPGGTQDAVAPHEHRQVSAIGGETMLLCVRPAAEEEAMLWHCAYVGLQIDLDRLLASTLQHFTSPDNTFVLAVDDPYDFVIVPPPAAVPADYEPPLLEASGLTLRAYPANPARLVAEADAAVTKRTLLLLALFVAALGGALWSWQSVSREAELANLKIDLVSRVSHELKTPLALIRMYGETLGMGRARDPGQAAEFGSIIARESDRLTTLIQRILDFSRQQAGTLQYAPHNHDLGELLRSIVEAYAPHLESRGILLIDELPLGIVVQCDASACESAVVNLLENAAKYGPEGEVEQEIELVLRATRDGAVIEVRDRGRGIPEPERERVFDGFYRASNSGEVRGAGLGLSLVRHFAVAHGGQIEALDNPGGGTILRLTLPLAPTAQATPTKPTSTGTTSDVSGNHP